MTLEQIKQMCEEAIAPDIKAGEKLADDMVRLGKQNIDRNDLLRALYGTIVMKDPNVLINSNVFRLCTTIATLAKRVTDLEKNSQQTIINE